MLVQALERLWESGCPYAAPPHDRTIKVAVRRWGSFERRNKRHNPTRADRVDDLAHGLYAALTPAEYRTASDPAMRDAECVAHAIADVLDPIQGDALSPGARSDP